MIALYENCKLCPRSCGVDRRHGARGYCRCDNVAHVAHSMLHMWEEPCLVGENGSGTVFFSGCSLGCVYCQNQAISSGSVGRPYSDKALAALYLSLEKQGAQNVNLVTAGHYLPQVVSSLRIAKERGLSIPVVYNTSSYEKAESLRLLNGLVDIYLADFRYFLPETAEKYSNAPDYPRIASAAFAEMTAQCPRPVFDGGMMRRGVIARLLLLPDHLVECKRILSHLYRRYGERLFFSLMSQYTPPAGIGEKFPSLARTVSEREYRSLVSYARVLGITQAYTQEGSAASESFIPPFSV